jgi:lon-related putative ATP-dependent protease
MRRAFGRAGACSATGEDGIMDATDIVDTPDGVPTPSALKTDALRRTTRLDHLAFATTAELTPLAGLLGQARAEAAVALAVLADRPGFNLFVMGPPEARMRESVKTLLSGEARSRPSPSDWVYVFNFADPDKPAAIPLPAGRARRLHAGMRKLIDDLQSALPAAFQSEDYQSRRSAIDERFQKKQADGFAALRDKAGAKDIAILRTPYGFALGPARNGEVVPPEEFNAWPADKRRQLQDDIHALEKDLEHVVHQIPRWDKERRDEVRALARETAAFAVGQLIEDASAEFADLPAIVAHMQAVRADLIENIPAVVGKAEDGESDAAEARHINPFERYEVNLFVTEDGRPPGAPIVEEPHPTLPNLIGRIEYLPLRGALVTSFRLIKAGALHRANGGYLLLDARAVLTEPFSWTALKRTLRQGRIQIEDVARLLGFASTVSLEPDPIPLDIKVVLFGDRLLYFMLAALDPEVAEHFKVLADFEDEVARSPEGEALLARLIAALVADNRLKAFDRDAVAAIIDHAARLAEHAGKLTLMIDRLRDLMIEADVRAGTAKRDVVGRDDVAGALQARIHRMSRLREKTQETILDKVALVDTEGCRVGQINGLSVLELGGFAFGRPTRITAQVRPGGGKVVDIEREVELGGPLHSKGVLILSGYLAGRYAPDAPMSLFASLVFEQSYGGVDGDSASSAELYCLLSALADVPLRQDLAVTGSVNQHGDVQAIGGVNEKIEGFFDICAARGLTGTQGVVIPRANVQHLMLREDVVAACADGRFAVYPVATIAEGLTLLTGMAAGERGPDGYPDGSVNARVETRLRDFARVRRDFARADSPVRIDD